MEASPAPKRRGTWLVAGIVVVVAAAGIAWFLLLKDDDEKGEPHEVSVQQLKNLEGSTGHPVYWVGPRRGYTYELTETENERILIRYLPGGVRAGDSRQTFLVVGTYPVPNAYKVLVQLSKREETVSTKVDGGIAVQDLRRPTTVYVAYPGLDLQAEEYDPSAKVARKLVFSGQVQPIR